MSFYVILILTLIWFFLIATEVTKGLKSYFWKFAICLFPCVLFGYVTADGVYGYVSGDPGHYRLKLGVDLEGGAILVYEIDAKKSDEKEDKGDKTQDLASALKNRIDPNDLFNIVIRPAGENRVEIILPTGGIYRAQKAEKIWDELLRKLETKYELDKNTLYVPRGRTDELADRVQLLKCKQVWDKIFKDPTQGPKAWSSLLNRIFARDSNDELFSELSKAEMEPKLAAIKANPGKFQPLYELLHKEMKDLRDYNNKAIGKNVPEVEFNNWVKREVWRVMLERVYNNKDWHAVLAGARSFERGPIDEAPPTDLAKRPQWEMEHSQLFRIPADSHERLVYFVMCKGNVIDEATLMALVPMLGQGAILPPAPFDHKTVLSFVEQNYGPSLMDIRKEIHDLAGNKTGQSLDLTGEEVQRIKELVSTVGSLEFLMLANNVDDKEAENAARAYFLDNQFKEERDEFQKEGLPPPGPRLAGQKSLKQFVIKMSHGNESRLTYRWVELGRQERKSLGLDNASETERSNDNWKQAARERDRATELQQHQQERPVLQGALFFSRKCLNRNLSEEERRAKKYEYFVLARNPEFDLTPPYKQTPRITGEYLVTASATTSNDFKPAVSFEFNSFGGTLFGNLTGKNVPSEGSVDTQLHRHLAIVLDSLIVSAPTIQSQITYHGQITGSFTQKEVDALAKILKSGALPATLKPQPVSESTMGPTLGLDTITKGVTSLVLAFAAVLLFMVVYYRFSGLVASVALLANLLLTIGFMIAVQATFTLPGLAGLVLMVGMAVDANVLIYERLREERERGASLALAIRNGYDRALPTIIDTHFTGIFTAVVLYVVGNDQLRGYGISLTVGLIISLFTSLYFTHVMFNFWLKRNWIKKLSMLRMLAKPNLDFMGIRNIMFAATLTLAVLGIGLFIGRLPNDLNIDFVGGTLDGGKAIKPLSLTEMRKLLDHENQVKMLGTVEVKEISIREDEKRDPGERDTRNLNGTRFRLTYAGDSPREISLANPVEGKTKAEREVALKERATTLPDPSVEQIYPSTQADAPKGMSRHFNVRTTEKEPELVQAMLDRLLREDNKPLMARIYMQYDDFKDKLSSTFRFYATEPPANFDPVKNQALPANEQTPKGEPSSPSYVRTLINRQLLPRFGKDSMPAFDLTGEGQSYEGKYKVISFSVKSEVDAKLTPQQKADIRQSVKEAQQEFNSRPETERLEVFDKSLANQTRYQAMWAVIASWGAILFYLWFRFGSWTFGLAAVLCLIHDLFFTLGVIAFCHFVDNTFLGSMLGLEDFKIDFPAVAALLTLVGYSVNDTIVVFDRIREVRGKSPELTPKMINDSINQTLSRTLLTSLTTWLVVIVLYIWGGPGVHLFAFVMVVGVIVGTYSSIYIASPLLLMFREGTNEGGKQSLTRPQEPEGSLV